MMRQLICGLSAAFMLFGCATQRPAQTEIEDAIRLGITACERHLVDGVPFADALSEAASGRIFLPETDNIEPWINSGLTFPVQAAKVEKWLSDGQPYRLMAQHVWAGPDKISDDGTPACDVIAVGGGGPSLRDAIVSEHIASIERTWTDATVSPRGKKAVCTHDRVATGKSLLIAVRVRDLPGVETVAVRDYRQFFVRLEVADTCRRGDDYWL